ncbi:MAG: hypothetical protein ACNA7O_08175 [Rhodobacterales bacterium]
MATPPRNTQRDHQKASSQSNAKRWGLYLAIALVILLVVLWLFGDVFTTDTVQEDEPAVQTTAPETTPETAPPATEPASPPPATTPGTGTETTPTTEPATDEAEEQDGVIEIEGDAEVEVLDES